MPASLPPPKEPLSWVESLPRPESLFFNKLSCCGDSMLPWRGESLPPLPESVFWMLLSDKALPSGGALLPSSEESLLIDDKSLSCLGLLPSSGDALLDDESLTLVDSLSFQEVLPIVKLLPIIK